MRVYLNIKGRVQGIGYRFFAVKAAQQWQLTGWVRNCANGDVECEAQGEENKVNAFCEQLGSGHPWAQVDKIVKENLSEKTGERSFEINS